MIYVRYISFSGVFWVAWCDFCTVTFSSGLHRVQTRGVKHARLGACGRCSQEMFFSDYCRITQEAASGVECCLPRQQERLAAHNHAAEATSGDRDRSRQVLPRQQRNLSAGGGGKHVGVGGVTSPIYVISFASCPS